MALLYGRAGRLTAKNGGFRPGQCYENEHLAVMGVSIGVLALMVLVLPTLILFQVRRGRCSHSDTTLYISLGILHTKYTGWC
jgi:hypothetical protein